MRASNKPGHDLVPFRVRLPREALRVAKNMAAQAGVDPAIMMGALLTQALESVADPGVINQIVESVRTTMGRQDG